MNDNTPDRFERLLGWAALALLAVVTAALLRGSAHWGEIGWQVWAHIATIAIALALTPVNLWSRRGDKRHRLIGYIWVAALAFTALLSFDIRLVNQGHFSVIHLLSIFTLIQLPAIVFSARAHNHQRHRRSVRGMVIGAMLVAGFFTFPFGRLLGSWLFG